MILYYFLDSKFYNFVVNDFVTFLSEIISPTSVFVFSAGAAFVGCNQEKDEKRGKEICTELRLGPFVGIFPKFCRNFGKSQIVAGSQ